VVEATEIADSNLKCWRKSALGFIAPLNFHKEYARDAMRIGDAAGECEPTPCVGRQYLRRRSRDTDGTRDV